MKVGTDSVLLGAVVPPSEMPIKALDIGTGTGILALMLAQRFSNAQIDAVEIDAAAALEAQYNFDASAWKNRLYLLHSSLQDAPLQASHYDLIISNPPYYFVDASYKINEVKRRSARYTHSLSHEEILQAVNRLLNPQGKFYVVLPSEVSGKFSEMAQASSLFRVRQMNVRMTPSAAISRCILAFSKQEEMNAIQEMVVYDEDRKRSVAYANLTQDFYL
ncbi:MAG: methyltransferase [Bacteroidetes bacterium]|jgi:tRNA1Val (adenine37-N6)-methyltransferase|nr:methyltransferase [Bacteroidota bacterium]